MDIIKLAKQEEQRLIQYRRYLHENPELSGQEFNTLRFIKKELSSMNIPFMEVEEGGILGFIDSGKKGKTVMLRADIDALPIDEDPLNTKGLPKPCVSKVKGVQHACGHDAHTAILLTAAKILCENKEAFVGKVVLCFERGEEANGNIFYLLKYFEDNKMVFDSCFGLHVGSFVKEETGSLVVRAGSFMAGMTAFKVTLKGQGGHGSRPDIANNPIDCFSSINESLANLRMKKINPFSPVTYSIGYLNAGAKSNVIPDYLTFAGTIRYFDLKSVGRLFLSEMQKVIDHTAQVYDCKVKYDEIFIPGYPLVNNQACADIAKRAFIELFGEVKGSEPLLGTESFSFYLQKTPGVFVVLCTDNEEKGIKADHHTAQFDVDEAVLYKGVCAHVGYAVAFLNGDDKIEFTPNAMSVDQIIAECGKKE